jgi:hypothetical protein
MDDLRILSLWALLGAFVFLFTGYGLIAVVFYIASAVLAWLEFRTQDAMPKLNKHDADAIILTSIVPISVKIIKAEIPNWDTYLLLVQEENLARIELYKRLNEEVIKTAIDNVKSGPNAPFITYLKKVDINEK